MQHRHASTFVLLLSALLATVAAGCLTNPIARKQKFYDQGLRNFAKQKYPEAIISFSRALQIDPRFIEAHYQLAQCHQRESNWAAAIQEPISADTLGWAYYHGGSFSVAAPLFEEAVKKEPSKPNYHYHLGLTYQKLNESVRARAELQKAFRIDPKSPVADRARRAESQAAGS